MDHMDNDMSSCGVVGKELKCLQQLHIAQGIVTNIVYVSVSLDERIKSKV